MLKLFHKEVKGHGQGHMFKIHGTIEKVLSWGTHMPNMNPLSLIVKKVMANIKVCVWQTCKLMGGLTDRVTTVGTRLVAGPNPKLLYTPYNSHGPLSETS